MKLKYILSSFLLFFSLVLIAQEENDHNYIRTRQMLNAEGTQFIESVAYFDGLGRATHQIEKNITPSGKHLITFQEYNACGKIAKSWLPTVSSEIELSPSENKSEAIGFYGDNRPYVENFYEATPSARVVEVQGVGTQWNGHSDRNEYFINNTTDLACRYYIYDNLMHLHDNGLYPAGSLFVTKQLDADNHEVYTFKDSFGNIILTRQKDGSNHDTYYVYDDIGRLCYVLPPMINGNISYANLEKYAYRYTYDIDGNCCEKKLPGCAPIYMVYDKAKRLILSQDGNQRTKNLWTCTKYDILGRVAYTCEIKETTPMVTLRTTYRNQLIKENYSPNSSSLKGTGYTCNFFANQVERLLEVNYYDDYQFLDNLAPTKKSKLISQQREGYATPYSCAKGLLTGKRVYELSNPRHYSTTSYYYDEKENVIQEHLCMSLGHENHIYSAYNFSNSLLKMQKEHHVYVGRNREKASATERYAMIYDHANRLIKTEYQFNNNPSIILKQNVYDELGRLQRIYRHNRLDSIGYKYNIRNQVTTIHNNDLREQLYYADSQVGNTACYNGNISAVAWNYKVFENCYCFQYDGLNRYTASHLIQNGHINHFAYATSLSYDKNGNITRLTRAGANSKQLDNLTYNYDGNQVKEISDAFGSKCTQKIKEYHDNHKGEIDFYYDANGNMIADLDRNIVAIRYNLLNLPDTIQFKDGNQIVNYYDATGALLQRKNRIISSKLCLPLAEVCKRNELLVSQNRKIFMDNCEFELETEKDDEEIVRVPRYNTSEGYVIGTGKQMRYYYQRKDHLGSVKELFYVDKDNHLITITEMQYYPSGLPMEDSNEKMAWVGSEKYNGKKYLEINGYDCSDYGARHYYPTIGRFTSVDPLAEKYYSVSPYAYCAGNPINRIDPTGLEWFWYSENGEDPTWHWHDGHTYNTGVKDNKGKEVVLPGVEAVVMCEGSLNETLGVNKQGRKDYINGEGAVLANFTVYGPSGAKDIKKYRGFTMSSDYKRFGAIANGEYTVNYCTDGKKGALSSHWAINNKGPVDCLFGKNPSPLSPYSSTQKNAVYFHRCNRDGFAGTKFKKGKLKCAVSSGCILIVPSGHGELGWDEFNNQLKGISSFHFILNRTALDGTRMRPVYPLNSNTIKK